LRSKRGLLVRFTKTLRIRVLEKAKKIPKLLKKGNLI